MSAAALALSLLALLAVFATPAGRAGGVALAARPRRQRVTDALFSAGIALQLAAPALDLAGLLAPAGALVAVPVQAVGLAAIVAAAALALAAQRTMGAAWNTGGEPRAGLVSTGPFAHVRNPVYTAFAAAATGTLLVVPGPVALGGLVLVLTGLQLQVRTVEEPNLLRAHGDGYARYAAATGRFVPGIGRRSRPSS